MSEFGRQLVEHTPGLRRYARALTRDPALADDLVQNCLLRALAKQHLWRPGSDLRAWLFTILHNQRASDLRQVFREQRRLMRADMAPAAIAGPGASLALLDLDRAIASLPESQRQVVLMIGLENADYRHCAAVLGVPIGTIRSRLTRARARLRTLLEIEDGFRRRPRRTAGGSPGAAIAA